jgi:hypothetical protein
MTKDDFVFYISAYAYEYDIKYTQIDFGYLEQDEKSVFRTVAQRVVDHLGKTLTSEDMENMINGDDYKRLYDFVKATIILVKVYVETKLKLVKECGN